MNIFQITKKLLLDALVKAMGAVDRKLLNPILSHCLISYQAGVLTFSTSDLEMQISITKKIEIQDYAPMHSFEVTVPAKTVHDFTRALQQDAVIDIFKMPSQRIRFKTQTSFLDVSSMDPKTFPLFNNNSPLKPRVHFQISRKRMKEMLELIQFAIAISDVRYYLNGVFMQIGKNDITCVATDGHRLSLSRGMVTILNFDDDLKSVIVPRRAVIELIRLLDGSEEVLDFFVNKDTARVVMGEISFSFKLIEGKFPDYRRVIPKNLQHRVTLDREEFKDAMAIVAPVLSAKDKGLLFHFIDGGVELRATNSDQQEVGVVVKADHVSTGMKIALNSLYVTDYLSHAKAKTLIIEYQDPSVGVVFSQDSHGSYVVMPLIL